MNPINNYRFGSYAILAMGLINLRYQTGNQGNLPSSSLLIGIGLVVLIFTFIPRISKFLLLPKIKVLSIIALLILIIYGILI